MPITRTTTRPSLMSRLRNRNNRATTTKQSTNPITGKTTTTRTTKETSHPHKSHHASTSHTHATTGTTTTGAHHHRRRPSMGDKFSGAMMKLRGSLTRRPGLKAAGTRRMHGTDGKVSHHAY
ncbi:hypothetical protein BDV97DRAFT_345212 [Delphinella strobiligena]|nr:hypothetical protein BDV97DRAFT_345212 [Delphinella strobiligena]